MNDFNEHSIFGHVRYIEEVYRDLRNNSTNNDARMKIKIVNRNEFVCKSVIGNNFSGRFHESWDVILNISCF